MLLAHLSDPHVTTTDTALGQWLDPTARLSAVAQRLARHDPPLDAVVITGDLTDHGTDEEYALLRQALDPLACPVYLLVGNHDVRATFVACFADQPWLVETGSGVPPVPPGSEGGCWTVERHDLRLVAVDTTLDARHDGAVSPGRRQWLAEVLESSPTTPTLLAMHHAPFLTGMWWMEYGGLAGAAELAEVVASHDQVLAVLCGHVHRSIMTPWANTIAMSAPSLTYQSRPALGPRPAPVLRDESVQLTLMTWADGTLTSYHVPLDCVPAPGDVGGSVDMTDLVEDPVDYERRARAGEAMPKELFGA